MAQGRYRNWSWSLVVGGGEMSQAAFVLLVVFAICVSVFVLMCKEAKSVHDTLDEFMRSAINAKSKIELGALLKELEVFHQRECWHRQFGSRSNHIAAYIRGKIESLK
jgi:uncharacterized membrane protein